jgi:hypothetical protein
MRNLAIPAAVMLLLAACGGPPPKQYDYPAWGFSAEFTAPPKVTETPASADGAQPHALVVTEEDGANDFAISAADATRPDKTIDQITEEAAPLVAKTVGGEVGPMTDVATVQTSNQAMGREVSITKGGKPFVTLRIYLANGVFYELAGRTVLGPDDPAAKAFLDSFKILPPAPAKTNAPAATNAN